MPKKIYPRKYGSSIFYVLRLKDVGVYQMQEVEPHTVKRQLKNIYDAYNAIGAIDFTAETNKIMNGQKIKMTLHTLDTKHAGSSIHLPNVYEDISIYFD